VQTEIAMPNPFSDWRSRDKHEPKA